MPDPAATAVMPLPLPHPKDDGARADAARSAAPSALAALPPQARTLFAILSRAAAAGAPCPSNFALMDALDLASPDGVRKHMGQLRDAGLVRVSSSGRRRSVAILTDGRRTAWSRANGHARAGAAFSDGWGNGSDALLSRMAAQGLDLTTMATRLGRTPSSVRHRLRRLRAAGKVAPAQTDTPAAAPAAGPARIVRPGKDGQAPRPLDPGPMRRDIITNDRDRPAGETAQIASFLARGGGRKLPPAYVGEVRGAAPLEGIAPISPRARRILRVMDPARPSPARVLALAAGVDPLLMPEILHELRTAGLVRRQGPGAGRRSHAPAPGYARTDAGAAMLNALGLAPAPAPAGPPAGKAAT